MSIYPKCSFDGPQQSLTLGANDQVTDPQQYRDLIVATHNGAPV